MKKLFGIIVLGLLWCNVGFAASLVEEIVVLEGLYKQGAITEEEFSKAKSILLETDTNSSKQIKNDKKSPGKIKSVTNKDRFKLNTDSKLTDWIKTKQKSKSITKEEKKDPDKIESNIGEENKSITRKSNAPLSKERSEKEVKMGIFLEDLKSIKTEYKNIDWAPDGLFDKKYNSFTAKAKYSLGQIGLIFVKQKGLLEKYPERMMKGMAYFEFFYQLQLKESKRAIDNFANNYPTWDPANIKAVQKIYSLNKARKTMREALGHSLEDEMNDVLSTYWTMYKLFIQSNTSKVKLTKEEKKINKLHQDITKEIGKAKALAEKKIEYRIPEDKFLKEYSKISKNLSKVLHKAEYRKEYELLSSFIAELHDYKNKDTSALLSGYKLADFILKDLKKDVLKKTYIQDLSKADFSNFTQDELTILGDITKKNKLNKNIKSNEIQIDILNLENNKLPVSKLLDVYRNDLEVKLESLNLQLASSESMNRWALSDWANAWKNPIPTKVQDAAGIEVNLSEKDIESLKAQLAMQNFKEIVEVDQFKDLIENNSDLNDLQAMVSESTKSLAFSYGLDDYAAALGDMYKMDINNYADLTALANAEFGTNYSIEEYSSAYQLNVDAINALQSGYSSLDVATLASSLGASLQDVADTITAASAAGISVDLEAAAEGLGFDSFADAVAAYNAEHGTSYTEQEARDALGQ